MNKLLTNYEQIVFLCGIYTKTIIFMCMLHKKGIYGVINLCMYPKEKKNQKKSCICLMYLLYYTHKDKTGGAKEAVIRQSTGFNPAGIRQRGTLKTK